MSQQRLDIVLVNQGLCKSRKEAKAMILAGKVIVAGQKITKAGNPTKEDAELKLIGKARPYVSRGGEKLMGAIEDLKIDVRDFNAIDVGASTGGFTDCLLQQGASHVHAIDVGYGQLDWKLRTDSRVTCIERQNIRYIDKLSLDIQADIITIDVSFISLRLVIPSVVDLLKPGGFLLAMVKPQFEAGRNNAKKGVVKDPQVIADCVDAIKNVGTKEGLHVNGDAKCRLKGPKGNQEHFILFSS